jgi:hypothetical protein
MFLLILVTPIERLPALNQLRQSNVFLALQQCIDPWCSLNFSLILCLKLQQLWLSEAQHK